MTKKEIKRIQIKAIMKAVKENFDMVEDFEDFDGQGFFNFAIEAQGKVMCFEMIRRDFEFITTVIKGDDNYKLGMELEDQLNSLRDVTLELLEQETGIPA